MEKLNLTLTKGYPTHSSDTSGLCRDQFIKVHRTQKWYDVYSEKKDFSWSKVYYWPNEPVVLSPDLLDSPYLLDHRLPGL